MNRVCLALLCLAALGAGAPDDKIEVISVELLPGLPHDDIRLGYSSPRRMDLEPTVPRFLFEVPKFLAKDPLFFRVSLGETKGVPFYGALDRSKGGLYHDLLYLDRDRDLDLTNDGEPVKARVRALWTTEGKLIEFLDLKVELPYTVEGKESKEPYSCVLYFVLQKGNKAPGEILVERDSWREAAVKVAGEDYVLAVVDDDSDGQYSSSDSWVMRPAGTNMRELLSRDATRSMLFPVWTKDQKFTVEVKSVGAAGRKAALKITPAKETEREFFLRVARQRQTPEERRLNLDPLRPKADANDKVDWIENKDVKYAVDIAKNPRVNKRILLDFTARTCPWCARMYKYTFRDREVVQLSKRFVCSKIAFQKGAPDATKYGVEGTPTYVILDTDGSEVARHAGFLRPMEFAAWLKSALR